MNDLRPLTARLPFAVEEKAARMLGARSSLDRSSRCEQMLLVMPHAIRRLRPIMTAGHAGVARSRRRRRRRRAAAPRTSTKRPNRRCADRWRLAACRSSVRCRSTTQLLLPRPIGSPTARWPVGSIPLRFASGIRPADKMLSSSTSAGRMPGRAALSEDAPGQFGHRDDRETARQIPAKFAVDHQAIDRAATARADSRANRIRSAVSRRFVRSPR